MSFFTPLNFLWLIPLAGTLLFLYFLRPRRTRFEVPSLFLWNAVAQSVRADRPFQRLKLSVLLLLQLLALLLLICALATPLTKPGPVPQADYVIILDQSAGMEATDVSPNRMAVAKVLAEQFVKENMRAGDSVTVIGAAESPTLICKQLHSVGEVDSAIESVQSVDTTSDIASALTFAGAAVRKSSAVALFTDGAWDPAEDDSISSVRTPNLRLFEVGSPSPQNVGIVEISERDDAIHPEAPPQLLVKVDRHNAVQSNLRIYVDGKPAANSSIPAGNGQEVRIFAIASLLKGGLVKATLSGMSRDDLGVDNSAELQVKPEHTTRVLLVTDGDQYLERALALLPDVDLYEEKPAEYTDISGQYDTVVFDNWLPVSLPKTPALVFNAIGANLPVVVSGSPSKTLSVVDWNETDPLMSYVDLSPVHIQSALTVVPALGGTVVAEGQDGPLIVKGEQSGLPIVWIGFAVSASDMPSYNAFPILLSNAIQTLSTGESNICRENRTGQPFLLPPTSGACTVTDPAGKTSTVPCSELSGCEYYGTQLAGSYDARSATSQQVFYIGTASSAITDIGAKDHPLLVSPSTQATLHVLRRIDLTPWLAAVALIIVLAEWVVYHRPSRYTTAI